MTRILLVGSGAREHCLAEALAADSDVYAVMQTENPGIKKIAKAYVIAQADDVEAAVKFAKDNNVELALIGPEQPLALGIVDALQKQGIGCVGPTKKLAQLEASKSFTRELLEKHGIDASPAFKKFAKFKEEDIRAYLEKLGQFVIKPDGLTGGKGVAVFGEHLHDIDESVQYCKEVVEAHGALVIEEKLEGEEFSLQTLTDGSAFVHFPAVQDHKRAYEGDRGPNTGGMGTYSDADFSLPFLSDDDIAAARSITERVAAAIKKEHAESYKGVMYGGFMKTAKGIKLIEYNARFGDPETMNVIPLLRTSLSKICEAVTTGTLGKLDVRFEHRATVCKYVVPQGYPEKPQKGPITIPLEGIGAQLYYGAVEKKDGELHMTGSRAVALVGIAESITEAEKLAEHAAGKVGGAVAHRADIGTEKLVRARVAHMDALLGRVLAPRKGKVRVALLLSGTGTNARRILEHERALGENSPYTVVMVFTDTADEEKCNARKIAQEYNLCYFCNDIRQFYAQRNKPRADLVVREEFDRETADILREEGIDLVALCGYMSIVTAPVYDHFLTVNIHPADLTVKGQDAKPRYAGLAGLEAVKQAILAGDRQIRSTVHLVSGKVDEGRILAMSEAIPVYASREEAQDEKRLDEIARHSMDLLKERGDWVIYPKAIERIASGKATAAR